MNEAQRITEWVEQKKESAIALARAVWGFAEPNWRETQSAAAISAALEAEGFALERRPCGMETAFVATWGGEGPVIAFLGEYDALPALSQQAGRAEKAPLCEGAAGHGCGHNLLGAGSFAAAVALKDYTYNEIRYKMLTRTNPQEAERLLKLGQQDVEARWKLYEQMAGPAVEAEVKA